MKTIEDIRGAVERFKELVAPQYREMIGFTAPYYMLDCTDGKADWPKGYMEVWGVDPLHGVYLIFDANDRLLYVGKAVGVGKRLNGYFGYAENRQCKVNDTWLAGQDARIARAIILSHDKPELHYLAPALEWFLIAQLNPPGNTQHLVKESSVV